MRAESVAESKPYITVQDYLEGERQSEMRHEYFDGTVTAMAGASDEHELVAGNLFAHAPCAFERWPFPSV